MIEESTSDRFVTIGASTRIHPEGDNIITLADIRLAIVAETLFCERFSDKSGAPVYAPFKTRSITVADIEHDLEQYKKETREKQRKKAENRKKGVIKPFSLG